jgi:antitoxin ParD1/3/4
LAVFANKTTLGYDEGNTRGDNRVPTRNVNLTDHYDQFVEELVALGRFKNASEVMRAGLRLLEQHSREEQEKLTALRALAAEGFSELDQGRGIVLDGREHLAEFISQAGLRAANRGVDSESGPPKPRSPGRSSKNKNSESSSSEPSGARRPEESR